MKHIAFIAAMTLLLTSCKSMTTVAPEFYSDVNVLDYYKIGLDGKILLTESNSVNFEYESLGSIVVTQYSGYEMIEKSTSTKESVDDDAIYGARKVTKSKTKYKKGPWKNASYKTELEEAVKKTVEMGGDAIINLKLQVIPNASNTESVSYTRYISGMVIRRK